MHCPARAVGRERAIVIEPRGRRALVLHGARTGAPSGGGGFGGGASGGGTTPAGGGRRAVGGRQPPRRVPGPTQAGTIYDGLGFDPCAAPTVAQMAAWRSSPYHAVGIYLGGTNLGCAQPNLNAAWVSEESAAGWHLIPTYVGLQAPSNSCGCNAISPRCDRPGRGRRQRRGRPRPRARARPRQSDRRRHGVLRPHVHEHAGGPGLPGRAGPRGCTPPATSPACTATPTR